MRHKTIHNTIIASIVLLLSTGITLLAQQSNTFYLMHNTPQSNLLNPAVQISCKYFVGIPVLNSSHFNYSNTAFTYNTLAGSDTWNIEKASKQMHRMDLYTGGAQLNLISLGYRHRSLYFTFNVAENAEFYQTIPGDLAQMAAHGNGPSVGEKARFDGLRPGAYHSRKYSLGVSKVMGPYLTAGLRANLIFGKANLSSGSSKLRAYTNEDNFALLLEGDYTLNSSFPMTITEDAEGNISGIEVDDINPVEYLLNRGNLGFGLDMGMIYRYSDEITLSASVLDLALIRWKTDLNNVQGEGEFEYSGTDLSIDITSRDFLNEMLDSILNTIDVNTSRNSYTYVMPTQVFLAGSYQYSERLSLGLVNRNVIYRSKLHSSFTLSAQTELIKKFTGVLSWSYLNNSLLNIGIGLAWHGKGIQFHAVTDNLAGFFYPFDTRTLNLRFGFNLMLGCPRNKKERMQEESFGRLPGGGHCPYPEKPEKKAKRRRKAVRRINR